MKTMKKKQVKEEMNGHFTKVIQVKVTDAMYEQVEILAKNDRRKLSDWARNLFEDTIKAKDISKIKC